MQQIDLSIIVAMTPNGVIGNEEKLLWRLPSDLVRFKKITMDVGTMVMGRKTYESILARNGKPLPDRKHIVLTRKEHLLSAYASVQLVNSLEEACTEIIASGGRACVIGGEEIYKLFLPIPEVRRIYFTIVHAPKLNGDVYFPAMDPEAIWRCASRSVIRKWNLHDEYETSYELHTRFSQLE